MRRCEKPRHTVLRALGAGVRAWYDRHPAVEVRRIEPTVVAEVDVQGASSMRDALSKGFRQVGGYIFGNNAGGQKVSMTSPVVSTAAAGGGAGGGGAPELETDPDVLAGTKLKAGKGAKIAMTSPVVTDMAPSGPDTCVVGRAG